MEFNADKIFIATFSFLYGSEKKARALLRRSDIESSMINFDNSANILWSEISVELDKQDSKSKLIETAIEEYTEDDNLILLHKHFSKKLNLKGLEDDANKIAVILNEYGFSSSFKHLIEFQSKASYFIREKIKFYNEKLKELHDDVSVEEMFKIKDAEENLKEAYLKALNDFKDILSLKTNFDSQSELTGTDRGPISKSGPKIIPKGQSAKNEETEFSIPIDDVFAISGRGTVETSSPVFYQSTAEPTSSSDPELIVKAKSAGAIIPKKDMRDDLYWSYNIARYKKSILQILSKDNNSISGILLKGGYILTLESIVELTSINDLQIFQLHNKKEPLMLDEAFLMRGKSNHAKYALLKLKDFETLSKYFAVDGNYINEQDKEIGMMYFDATKEVVCASSGTMGTSGEHLNVFSYHGNESMKGAAILNEAFYLIGMGLNAKDGFGKYLSIKNIIEDISSQKPNMDWPFIN